MADKLWRHRCTNYPIGRGPGKPRYGWRALQKGIDCACGATSPRLAVTRSKAPGVHRCTADVPDKYRKEFLEVAAILRARHKAEAALCQGQYEHIFTGGRCVRCDVFNLAPAPVLPSALLLEVLRR